MSNRLDMIQAALSDAEETLADVRARMRTLIAEEETLAAEVDGLRLAIAAHQPQPQKESLADRLKTAAGKAFVAIAQVHEYREAWRQVPLTAAIEYLFAEVSRPLHRQEIATQLVMRGRDDTLGAISAALTYLKRIGRAESLGKGRWLVRSPRRDAPFELRDFSAMPALPYMGNGSLDSDA